MNEQYGNVRQKEKRCATPPEGGRLAPLSKWPQGKGRFADAGVFSLDVVGIVVAASAGFAAISRLMKIFAAARVAVGEEPIAAGGRRALMKEINNER